MTHDAIGEEIIWQTGGPEQAIVRNLHTRVLAYRIMAVLRIGGPIEAVDAIEEDIIKYLDQYNYDDDEDSFFTDYDHENDYNPEDPRYSYSPAEQAPPQTECPIAPDEEAELLVSFPDPLS